MFGVVIPYITGPLPAAQYAVDSSSLTTSSVPNTTRTLTGAKFYTSEYFPFGFHTLTVNVTTATDNAPYLFDYLAIDTTDPPASSSSSSSSATSSFSHTSSSSSPTSSDTALHAQGASTSNAPTGAIVGGVIGGVVLLAAIAIGAWWLWKKNRTYDQSSYAYAKTGQYGTRPPLAQSPLGLTRSLPAQTAQTQTFTPTRTAPTTRPARMVRTRNSTTTTTTTTSRFTRTPSLLWCRRVATAQLCLQSRSTPSSPPRVPPKRH